MKKKATSLETNFPKVRQMSRPKFFTMAKQIPFLKPTFLNMCGLHINAKTNQTE